MKKIFLLALFLNVVFLLTIESKNNTEYYISSEAISFLQAWAFCNNYGMKFISFANADENDDLIERMDELGVSKPAYFWVGGFHLTDGLINKWYWVDGEVFAYSNWYSDDLVSGSNCIRWDYTSSESSNGGWYADDCEEKHNFVCSN